MFVKKARVLFSLQKVQIKFVVVEDKVGMVSISGFKGSLVQFIKENYLENVEE